MKPIRMQTESLMHGDSNSHNLVGQVDGNSLMFDDGIMRIDWTDTTIKITNGVNLELDKVTVSNINTGENVINLNTKMTELTIEDNRIIFIYEIIVQEEVQEIRKLEYRW